MVTASPEKSPSATDIDNINQESKQQPAWHVLVLTIFTMSAYTLVWFYKTLRDLHEQSKLLPKDSQLSLQSFQKVSPFLLTLALLVPGVLGGLANAIARAIPPEAVPYVKYSVLVLPAIQLFIAYKIFSQIAELDPDKTSFAARHPVSVGLLLSISCLLILLLGNLKGAWYLLYLLVGLPLALAQHWMNKYWSAVEEPNLVVRHAFSAVELVFLVLGAIFLGLVVTGFATS